MNEMDIEVSGLITTQEEKQTANNMFQLPANILLSPPAAREWFGKRKETVRPWMVFINTSNFQAPRSLPRLSRRIVKNIEYFQSNYLFVFIGVVLYCLITSPLLLFAVAASLGAGYILHLRHAEGKKLALLSHEIPLAQQYGVVAICSLPIFYLAGAGAALFWVLGASLVIITLHAACYNIDAVLSQDESRFDLVMEEV